MRFHLNVMDASKALFTNIKIMILVKSSNVLRPVLHEVLKILIIGKQSNTAKFMAFLLVALELVLLRLKLSIWTFVVNYLPLINTSIFLIQNTLKGAFVMLKNVEYYAEIIENKTIWHWSVRR